jgi:CheY-like chemotaxis protein
VVSDVRQSIRGRSRLGEDLPSQRAGAGGRQARIGRPGEPQNSRTRVLVRQPVPAEHVDVAALLEGGCRRRASGLRPRTGHRIHPRDLCTSQGTTRRQPHEPLILRSRARVRRTPPLGAPASVALARRAQVVLMDVRMPRMDGLATT